MAVGIEEDESTPAVLSERHGGRTPLPLASAQFLYGVMPPVPDSVTEYAVPTETVCCAVVRAVIAGAAGTVIVAVPFFEVSAIEVAVTVIVCAELVAAGAVRVTPLVLELERVPALVAHVTPAAFLSLVTVADSVVVSVPSTVAADDVTATDTVALELLEPPPHPVMQSAAAAKNTMMKENCFQCISNPRTFKSFGCEVLV